MLSDRRDEQCKTLFKQLTNQSHILHRLLPAKCDAQLIGRLRSANLYPTVMHGQLVFSNPLYHIHWLIFSDLIFFVITVCRRCILCVL